METGMPSTASVDILLPTFNRPESLIMTLAGVAGQTLAGMRVVVADQSDAPAGNAPAPHARDFAPHPRDFVLKTARRIIEARGGRVEWHQRAPRWGIAEQRDFLLKQARADYVLYLDDDVFMEPWVAAKLVETLRGQGCGFVGAFPNGLSFRDDVRPHQQIVEYWEGRVQPEAVEPGSPEWERAQLHRAANLYHASRSLRPGESRLYKVAWVASCVLYDRRKLVEVGGFSFWSRLPRYHSGEEVLVQNLLVRRWGGCALMPSGTYHTELPSTVLNDEGSVDGHALDLLPEMVERYASAAGRAEQVGAG
jgi:GT2 family glycosyltransferase